MVIKLDIKQVSSYRHRSHIIEIYFNGVSFCYKVIGLKPKTCSAFDFKTITSTCIAAESWIENWWSSYKF